MTYTPEIKEKIKMILAAFGDYIADHEFFDIVYSEKFGYLQLLSEGGAIFTESMEPIKDDKELFQLLVIEIAHDVRDLFMCGEHTDCFFYPEELEEVNSRVERYLERLPMELREHYKGRVAATVKDY